jgi:hypothetical protein
MAMPMPMPMPLPLHDVQAPAATPEEPVSGTRVRRDASPQAPASTRLSPDEEAMQLMLKVVERVEVAKSFAKIAAGIFTVTAARAGVQVRAVVDAKMAEAVERDGGVLSRVERVRTIARAAKDAAVHVATHRPEPAPDPQVKPEPKPEATTE